MNFFYLYIRIFFLFQLFMRWILPNFISIFSFYKSFILWIFLIFDWLIVLVIFSKWVRFRFWRNKIWRIWICFSFFLSRKMLLWLMLSVKKIRCNMKNSRSRILTYFYKTKKLLWIDFKYAILTLIIIVIIIKRIIWFKIYSSR